MNDLFPDLPAREDDLHPALNATAESLQEWLAREGRDSDSFSAAEIRQIHRVSGGDPERIGRLAAQHFRDPALYGERRAGGGRRAWLAAAAVLAVAAVLLGIRLAPAPRHGTVTTRLELPRAPAPAARGDSAATWKTVAAQTVAEEETAPPAPVSAAPAAPEPAGLPGVRAADWLEREDGDRYVLQLIGATEMQTLENYLRRSGIPARKLTLVHTEEQGRPWHILVYGAYDSADAAREDGRRLPSYARGLHPWPRRVAAVRGENAAP